MERLYIPSSNFPNTPSSEGSSFISTSDGHVNNFPTQIVLSNILSQKNPKQDAVFYKISKKVGMRLEPKPNSSFVLESQIGIGVYSGQVKDSVPNGLGILKKSKNWTYYGEWKSGTPKGLGCLDCKNNGKYIGEFKKGQYHGQGQFINGKDYYIGQWKKNLQHGEGELYQDGIFYRGEFKKGAKHGSGIFENKHLRVKGSFDCNELVYGKTTDLESRCRYEGQWHNYKSNGKGTLKFSKSSGSNFRRLSGVFKDGQFLYGEGILMGCKTSVKVKMEKARLNNG